jgi:hypothetical protein
MSSFLIKLNENKLSNVIILCIQSFSESVKQDYLRLQKCLLFPVASKFTKERTEPMELFIFLSGSVYKKRKLGFQQSETYEGYSLLK